LIELEFDMVDVGPPLSIVELGRRGQKWIESDKSCPADVPR
jgi:hypothetical protein